MQHVDLAGARHQQAERHGLRIAIGELGVAGLRKQQMPPILRQIGERSVALLQLFDGLVAQKTAQPRADAGEFTR